MKWHYACLSEYPQTANACLVETPDAYRVMWYSNMDKRWYPDADKQDSWWEENNEEIENEN